MRWTLLICAVLLFPGFAAAEDKTDEKFVSLFDGKTLDGWKVSGQCEAVVEDGTILLKSGNGWVHSTKTYKDFVLELDWKPGKWEFYDSGVYVRAEMTKKNQPWPGPCQINLRKDLMGAIKEYPAAVARPDLVKPDAWNHFRITATGKTLTLEMNGKLAWKLDNFSATSGYIGLQCEVPGGGTFQFRNIRISTK